MKFFDHVLESYIQVSEDEYEGTDFGRTFEDKKLTFDVKQLMKTTRIVLDGKIFAPLTWVYFASELGRIVGPDQYTEARENTLIEYSYLFGHPEEGGSTTISLGENKYGSSYFPHSTNLGISGSGSRQSNRFTKIEYGFEVLEFWELGFGQALAQNLLHRGFDSFHEDIDAFESTLQKSWDWLENRITVNYGQ